MVVAVMVVFVVMLLATVVFSQAVHNTTASGDDRKRLQSVDAAEAGLNYFFNYWSRHLHALPSRAAVAVRIPAARCGPSRPAPAPPTRSACRSPSASTWSRGPPPSRSHRRGTTPVATSSTGHLQRLVSAGRQRRLGGHDERDDLQEDGDVPVHRAHIRRFRGCGRDEHVAQSGQQLHDQWQQHQRRRHLRNDRERLDDVGEPGHQGQRLRPAWFVERLGAGPCLRDGMGERIR